MRLLGKSEATCAGLHRRHGTVAAGALIVEDRSDS